MNRFLFSSLSVLFLLALPAMAQEIVPLVPQTAHLEAPAASGAPGDAPSIVNGRLTRGAFPTVASLLLTTSDPLSSRPALQHFCTATLIGCRTLLSAAHCFCPTDTSTFAECENDPRRLGPDNFIVYLQHGGFFLVDSLHLARLYEFERRKDVAVIRLRSPVSGISPTPINEVRTPPPGTAGSISGYGLTAGGRTNGGVKRSGQVRSSRCHGVPNGAHVCWNFQHPVGSPGVDSNTCQGDSGGPLFVNLGGRTVVAGITSGGSSPNCLANDESFDTNVFAERGFIRRFGGSDLDNRTCGGLPQVGGRDVQVLSAPLDRLFLNRPTPQRTFSFGVAPGTRAMLVSLNGRDGNGIVAFDFDLVLTSPSGQVHRSVLEPTADDELLSSFDVITLEAPESGTWLVSVQKGDERPNRNNGVFQLTATLFSGGGAAP